MTGSPDDRDVAGPLRDGDGTTDALLLLLTLIWGVNFAVIKAALSELHPFAFNALRFPLASLVLYLLLRRRGALVLPRAEDRLRIVGLGILGNIVYQPLFILGLDLTTAGNASLLLATTPVWTLLLSSGLRHEEPSRRVWMGIAGTVAGMILVVGGGGGLHLARTGLVGDLLMVGAAVTWSLYTVGARDLVHRYGSLAVTSWTLWVGSSGLVLLGLPWLRRTDLGGVSPAAWAGVAYAGVFAISVAYAIWYRGVHRLGNARTAAYSNLVPVVALVAAWVWLGEVPGLVQIGGACVILGGLWVARTGRSPKGARRSRNSTHGPG